MRLIPLLGALLFPALSAANAQDAVKVDPDHHRVEFENAHVRVLRVRYGPHERSAMHSHPSSVVVFLTDLHVKFTYPSGKVEQEDAKAGHAGWANAVTHTVENLSDSASELIEVELKSER